MAMMMMRVRDSLPLAFGVELIMTLPPKPTRHR